MPQREWMKLLLLCVYCRHRVALRNNRYFCATKFLSNIITSTVTCDFNNVGIFIQGIRKDGAHNWCAKAAKYNRDHNWEKLWLRRVFLVYIIHFFQQNQISNGIQYRTACQLGWEEKKSAKENSVSGTHSAILSAALWH